MSDVTVYSTPTCPYCKLAKAWLEKRGIQYKEINVADNEKAANEMIKKSGQMGVPVIVIDDKVVVGFDESELGKIFKKNE